MQRHRTTSAGLHDRALRLLRRFLQLAALEEQRHHFRARAGRRDLFGRPRGRDRRLERLHRIGGPPLVHPHGRQRERRPVRVRIPRPERLQHLLRLVELPQKGVVDREVVVRGRVIGIQLDRFRERLDRLLNRIGPIRVVQAFDVVPIAKRQAIAMLEGDLIVLVGAAPVANVVFDLGELRQRERETRIRFHRFLQQRRGLVVAMLLLQLDRLRVVPVRLDRIGRDALHVFVAAGVGRLRRELRDDPLRQLVDDGEEVGVADGVGALDRQDASAVGLLQFRVDANRVARFHEAAEQHRVHAGAPGDFLHGIERDRALVLLPERRQHLQQPIGAEHVEIRRLREIGDEQIGQPAAQPLELRVAGVVLEVEDGERHPAGADRGAVRRHKREPRDACCREDRDGRDGSDHDAAPALRRRDDAALARSRKDGRTER